MLVLTSAGAAAPKFTSFEARQTHSIALTPDAQKLMALNSPAGSLSVFDVASGLPTLIAEIPVGIEPVAVRARTNDEVWVVNEVSDTISVVSLSKKAVVATLQATDEPADVVFAQGKAYVTCARNRVLRVFDTATLQEAAPIPLQGMDPRTLAVNAAGTKVYIGFLHSGNGTTILPREKAPAQPVPMNPNIPEGPDVSQIVPVTDSRIPYTVLDHDVAELNVGTGALAYFGGIGTNIFDLAVASGSGAVWVGNTEALNLIAFEEDLRGHFVDSRLTNLNASTGTASVYDLNAGVDYGVLPNPAARATTLAQPTGIALTADGGAIWVAAFASDRIAKVSTSDGQVLLRADLRPGGGNSSVMRGPRALALHPTESKVFVLNKLSDTLSTVSTTTGELLAEVPLSGSDLMPAKVRAGRGFLFDARISGNGTISCASCHLDADRDGLAWDLGSLTGDMSVVIGRNLSAHDLTPRQRVMHPMKGPMITQTLRGMADGAPFHWRGDKPTLQSFNPTFERLMGGQQIPDGDMDNLAAYLVTLRHHPNPNRTKFNSLPATFNNGNPTRGLSLYQIEANHCGVCHKIPTGSDKNIDLPTEVGASQPFKNPSLSTVYQRMFFDPRPGATTLTGFGLLHDGVGSILPTVHPYALDQLATPEDFADVAAFVMCFDTGTSTTVGDSFTVTSASTAAFTTEIARMEGVSETFSDVVVSGVINGALKRFYFSRVLQVYIPESLSDAPLNRDALLAALKPGDALTFVGVPPGEGVRYSGALGRQAQAVADTYLIRTTKSPLVIPKTKGLLANDGGIDSMRDIAEIKRTPTLGQISGSADGSFAYIPGEDFAKSDHDGFSYEVLLGADVANSAGVSEVTVSSYAKAAGRYIGLLQIADSEKNGALLSVNVTAGGTFSAALDIGAKRWSFAGKVDQDGSLTFKPKPGLSAILRLQVTPDGFRRINASVGESLSGVASRVTYTKTAPAPGIGKRTLILTPGAHSASAPLAPGAATLTVSKTSMAKIVGKLGDGTAFSFSSPLVGDSTQWTFPIYRKLYKYPAGIVDGDLAFAVSQAAGVTGTLSVDKPPQTKPVPFKEGFQVEYVVGETLR